MNRLVALAVLAFSIALAFLIGQRLSDQAMAVIVGSVIGVAASLPMTAIVLGLTLRQREIVRQSSPYGRSDGLKDHFASPLRRAMTGSGVVETLHATSLQLLNQQRNPKRG